MIRLQDFSFNKSQYERPNQKKVCGWSVFGKPCQIGPDANGNCQAQFECVPYKDGDRWSCTRPSNAGGKCKHGPSAEGICCNKTPRCVPLDSTRNKRGKLVFWTTMLAFVFLVFAVAMPLRSNFIDPGPLTTKHSLEGNHCNNCHKTSATKPGQWFANAFVEHDANTVNQSCRQCHDLGFNDASPHSLPGKTLALMTKQMLQNSSADFRLFTPAGMGSDNPDANSIACASCHAEHRGRDHNLIAMSSQQCASCHVTRHTGFANDHPELNNYPYKRRTRIVFDHTTHINDYFQKQKLKLHAPQNCSGCHAPDQAGRYMVVKSFENSCSGCHAKDVTGEKLEAKGFPVLSVPAIDLDALTANGLHIGQWPGDMEDEEMTALMIFLLSSDKKLHPVLRLVSEGKLTLSDLGDQNATVLKHVQYLAWGIKQLFHDIVTGGHEKLLQRIKSATVIIPTGVSAASKPAVNPTGMREANGVEGTPSASALLAQLPVTLIKTVQRAWFPALDREMKNYRQRKVTRTQQVAVLAISSGDMTYEDWAGAGGWYDQDYSIYYRPSGHADNMLHSWLETTRPGASTSTFVNKAFEQLSYNKLPGQCSKCHSIDKTNDGIAINWQGLENDPANHTFTHFKHESHFSLLSEEGCKTCHTLNNNVDTLRGYKDQNPMTFESNWNSIDKKTCATCHTSRAAGDNCTLCHNYHVGNFKATLPASELTAQK